MSSITQARNEDLEPTARSKKHNRQTERWMGDRAGGRKKEKIQRKEKPGALVFFPKLSGPLPTPSTKHKSRKPPPAIWISPPVPLIHKLCIHTCSTRPESKPLN